jgi:hypothetical protein
MCSSEKTAAFVLSNFGGFGGTDAEGNAVDLEIVPRSSDTGSPGSDNHEETTLDPSEEDHTASEEQSESELEDGIAGSPDAEANPCLGCGTEELNEGLSTADLIFTSPIDLLTNVMRQGRINKKNRRKSSGAKDAIQGLIDEVKDMKGDPEEGKVVYEKVDYTPVTREDFDKSQLEELLDNRELAKFSEFDFKVFQSTVTYPLTKDCMGEYIYGDLAGQPIRLLEVPNEAEIPFYVSFQNGVKSQKTLGVDEFEDAYCFFIGFKIEGIEFPTDDELHTPLCEKSPYTIYMAETTPVNRRIVAKGIMPHTFSGRMNGKTYAFPKHAVNSIEHVDRHIQSNSDIGSGSHMGAPHSVPIFTFHSPDSAVNKPLLNVDNAFIPGDVFGTGRMHGQYAYGEEPTSSFFGRQKDQKGVRQSINLNKMNFPGQVEIPVSGLTFAKGNKVITNANGIDLGLCNLYRESSVFLQLESMPPPLGQGVQGGYADHSFIGQGLNHSCSIPYAASHFAVLRNEIPDQYGSVESLVYIDTGLSANGRQTSIEGIAGDGFIGPWTIKRTSYVSNKVGDEPIVPSKRRVPGILQYFGFGDCTRPPDSGDRRDVKNRKNLHPDQGCGIRPEGPDTDIFFPRTLNTMVAYWVESRVNVWYRATGVETGKVFYPKLKDLNLDSSVPNGTPWENGWLNRFYCLINRSSKLLIMIRAALRLGIFFGGLWNIISTCLTINSVPDIFTFILRLVLLIALWSFAFFFIFTNRNINKLLGLDECLDDRQGAMDHEQIRGWEDNHFDYNPDYSLQNRYNFAIGVPDPYNVCDCDDCTLNQVTHEIFISNPQVVGSPVDAYKNFQANSYLTFPLDSGKITKLVNFQDRLLAHTTDSFKIVSYRGQEVNIGDGNVFIGGGYLENAQTLGGDTPEGSFGLQHPNHSFQFPGGYLFIDEKAKKIWLMTSLGEIRDISNIDNKAFFRSRLPFCNEGSCKGEGVPNEIGYTFGYDPYEELLYITKKDGDCGSFTISYDLERGRWFSYHSFIPQRYLSTRTDMFTIKDGKFWIHNKDKNHFLTYYDEFYPHIIEFVTKKNILATNELDDYKFYTQANRSSGANRANIFNLKETFNKGIFYNNTQCSGELHFEFKSDGLGNMTNLLDNIKDKGLIVPLQWVGEQWQVNRIRDIVDNWEAPIWLSPCDCSVDKVLNESNLNINRIKQTPNIIYDRFLKSRLIYDLPSAQNTQLITHFNLVNNKIEIQ